MGFLDFFRPVARWSAEETRRYVQESDPGDFNLIDVRQPLEYEQGHLPGACLVPIAELDERLDEFDRYRPTIVYSGSGLRCEAAASLLRRSGFIRTVTMEGGFQAWKGLTAKGRPEMVMTWFFPAHRTAEHIALAWYLEEGTREYYARVAEKLEDADAARLYGDLAKSEVEHEEMLLNLYREVGDGVVSHDFPRDVIELGPKEEEFMEGGIPFGKALSWSEGKSTREILELTIGMETSACDRYLFMYEKVVEKPARRVFAALAKAEKQHLRRVTAYFDQLLETDLSKGIRVQKGS